MRELGEAVNRPALRQALQEARFEVIPLTNVYQQVALLPKGTAIPVTCSQRFGMDRSLELAAELRKQDYLPIPHLAARLVRDRGHLRSILARIVEIGVTDVFVVGGDEREPSGEFSSALELLQAMAEMDSTTCRIGVAAYPEGHPLITSAALLTALKNKQQFAAYMVTQICFDPETIAGWLRQMRAEGIRLPVYIGMPGVIERKKLFEIALKIGVGGSARFINKHAGLVGALARHNTYTPDALIQGLTPLLGDPESDVAGLHLNTFNQIGPTEGWRQELVGLEPPPESSPQ